MTVHTLYKLFGGIIRDDLQWSAYVEYIIAKAAKKITPTLVLPKDMLKVYLCNIRLVLEYAAQVWQDIPAYTVPF